MNRNDVKFKPEKIKRKQLRPQSSSSSISAFGSENALITIRIFDKVLRHCVAYKRDSVHTTGLGQCKSFWPVFIRCPFRISAGALDYY
jgi:hypothetical protein